MIVPALLALLAFPHVATVRLARAPSLDGRTDDPVWADVPVTTGLVQKEPDLGAVASEPTGVRVGYTDDALWIAIDCTQVASRRIARLTRRDRVEQDDRITVDLDTRAEGRSRAWRPGRRPRRTPSRR